MLCQWCLGSSASLLAAVIECFWQIAWLLYFSSAVFRFFVLFRQQRLGERRSSAVMGIALVSCPLLTLARSLLPRLTASITGLHPAPVVTTLFLISLPDLLSCLTRCEQISCFINCAVYPNYGVHQFPSLLSVLSF